ncbi:MAG: copper homeostasis protein CutC [Clostridiaceae bacterium]
MVRPRGAGFCYLDEDFQVMLKECETLMKSGADGIAFGCLNEDHTLDIEKNKAMIEIIKRYHGEAVFHRAFDCTIDPFKTIEQLIEIGVDRVLTSGHRPKAIEGKELIKNLQEKFGDRIEILAGSGVNATNANELMEMTGIHQVHSSCKDWLHDPTTSTDYVSFSYGTTPNENGYEVVSHDLVRKLIEQTDKKVR